MPLTLCARVKRHTSEIVGGVLDFGGICSMAHCPALLNLAMYSPEITVVFDKHLMVNLPSTVIPKA